MPLLAGRSKSRVEPGQSRYAKVAEEASDNRVVEAAVDADVDDDQR